MSATVYDTICQTCGRPTMGGRLCAAHEAELRHEREIEMRDRDADKGGSWGPARYY
jgi:hypothetical protein